MLKAVFFIYWGWFLWATLFFIHQPMSVEIAKAFVCIHHLSYMLVVGIPMVHLVIMRENLDKVKWNYVELCLISFLLRGASFMIGVWTFELKREIRLDWVVNNLDYVVLALCGVIMGLWCVFNVDRHLEKI